MILDFTSLVNPFSFPKIFSYNSNNFSRFWIAFLWKIWTSQFHLLDGGFSIHFIFFARFRDSRWIEFVGGQSQLTSLPKSDIDCNIAIIEKQNFCDVEPLVDRSGVPMIECLVMLWRSLQCRNCDCGLPVLVCLYWNSGFSKGVIFVVRLGACNVWTLFLLHFLWSW